MKTAVLFAHLMLFGFLNQAFSQENLIPNGHFDENIQNYSGGIDPVGYYTADLNCNEGRERFENDMTSWRVAKSNADLSQLPGSFLNPQRRCSPDWIAPYTYDFSTTCTAPHTSYYLSHGVANESVMAEMKNGYKLIKGKTYKFRVKVRSAMGSGSFQLVFSKDSDGLHVQPHKKWVAGDFYLTQDCQWKNIEYYFTVPNSSDKDYEDMNYVILQFNHEINLDQFGSKVALHYDDVFLAEGEECEDIKYIQDWIYFETAEIVQANQAIHAGAYVSPYAWDENLPVIVKSGSFVIYRAPSITLEPGFFIEEPGSYFETQVGTCVEDPCPTIQPFTPSTNTVCSSGTTFGNDIVHQPGVFYVWEPTAYFSAPWSVQTEFNPPTGSGCIDASLTVWTICGDLQTFNFPINYFESPASLSFTNVVLNPNQFSFDLNVQNASSYSIQAVNTATGDVIYETQQSVSCSTVDQLNTVHLSFDPCQYDMCGQIQVTATVSNECFGSESETLIWTAPPPQQPLVMVENLVMNDFEYNFDVANITSAYEYVQIQVLNASQTQVICDETHLSCSDPDITSLHIDVTNCLSTGCLSQCEDYVVKVILKNVCNPTPDVLTQYWTKSSNTLIAPASWPNVITLNGDGANDALCFTPLGADTYHLVVVNQWGNTFYDGSGCITESPICLWEPPINISDGVYFYIVEFYNTCGDYLMHQDFVHLINEFNMILFDDGNGGIDVKVDLSYSPSGEESNEQINANTEAGADIQIFPNPTSGFLKIESHSKIEKVTIFNSIGAVIRESCVGDYRHQIDMSEFGSGVYTFVILRENGTISQKVIVL